MTAGVHPMGDLAPRDVVAAAIDARMKAIGDPCVYLDARGIDGFEARFPTVTASCRAVGIDPVRQPIPVTPGAHYSCGGVVTDVYGQTELPGLFAAGEVARTGMHGANRLASNSLLEGLVVGGRAGQAAAAHAAVAGPSRAILAEPTAHTAPKRAELQRAMSRHASVVRGAAGLQQLSEMLSSRAGSQGGEPSRLRRRRAGAGRSRGDRRGPGPQRKSGLPPPRRVLRRRTRPSAQQRRPAGR